MAKKKKEEEVKIDYIKHGLETTLENDYMAYALGTMYRQIPRLSDGLTAGQRRVLVSLHDLKTLGLVKSARVVGDCIGKYSPHGDSATYQTLVNMSQPFKKNVPTTVTQGNWGSVDTFAAAAMRYTEVKIAPLIQDIYFGDEYRYNDFIGTYDQRGLEPISMAPKIPMILINGVTGSCVGFQASFPPHNPVEVCDLVLAYLKGKVKKDTDVIKYLKGPDFPTGGIMVNQEEAILRGLCTGSAKVVTTLEHSWEKILPNHRKRPGIILKGVPYLSEISTYLEAMDEKFTKSKEVVSNHLTIYNYTTDHNNVDITITLSKREMWDDFVKFINDKNILKHSTNYSMLAMDDVNCDNMNGATPERVTIVNVIDSWFKHRKKILDRYFADYVNILERNIKNKQAFLIFIQTPALKKSVEQDTDKDMKLKFNRMGIDDESLEYILRSTYQMSRKNAEAVQKDINQLCNTLAVATTNKNDVVSYITVEVSRIRGELISLGYKDRKTKIIKA